MKTVITALVSAVIGGLVAALAVSSGLYGFGGEGGGGSEVELQEATSPVSEEASLDGGSNESSDLPVQEIYDSEASGVVNVDVASEERGPGGGSGFVISEEGHIVTNQHVVRDAVSVSVRFIDGGRRPAEVVGTDASTDIAVLEVDAPEELLEPLTLGDSGGLEVGQPVVAVGNPLDVGISVTTGIVSGLGRPIQAPNGYTIDGAIQTDAAINPGSSGGPLLNAGGAVIGMNSQIATRSGGFQGVGFAVPVDTLKNVTEQLISEGDVAHAYLGVRMLSSSIEELMAYTGVSEKKLREEHGLPSGGVIIREATRGAPAYEAGIRGGEEKEIGGIQVPVGDVITEIGGEPVSATSDIIEVVNSRKPGKEMRLTVVSPGEEPREVTVRLGERPEES